MYLKKFLYYDSVPKSFDYERNKKLLMAINLTILWHSVAVTHSNCLCVNRNLGKLLSSMTVQRYWLAESMTCKLLYLLCMSVYLYYVLELILRYTQLGAGRSLLNKGQTVILVRLFDLVAILVFIC